MIIEWSDWRDAANDDRWIWPHFSPSEMACRGTGALKVDTHFMGLLEELRRLIKPLPVTSGYRTPEHNRAVSSTGLNGPHTRGAAVDIAISGLAAFRLVQLALEMGFTGIGLKQHGSHEKRFVHLDTLSDGRPTVWTYP